MSARLEPTVTQNVRVLPRPTLRCVACPRAADYDVELTRSKGFARLCDTCWRHYLGREPSCVYFVRGGDFVKIGHSTNLAGRIKSHQTGSPYPLEVWHTELGGREEEAELHRRFAADRAHGEWFRISDEIRAYVEGGGS